MKSLKKRIKKLIRTAGPKHFSVAIRGNKELYDELIEATNDFNELSISARAYIVKEEFDPRCPKGKVKSFESITKGFKGGCGRARDCECLRSHISIKVSKTKSKATKNQVKKSNQKRTQTNLQTYGVANTGQTPEAKRAHKEFYENLENVENQLQKMKDANLERLGVDNAMKDPEVAQKVSDNWANKSKKEITEIVESRKSTSRKRYDGCDFPQQHPTVAKKISDATRHILDPEGFKEYVRKVNLETDNHKFELLQLGYRFGTENHDLQIDHIVSKRQGFQETISPEIIGNKRNLMITTGVYNKSKSDEYRDPSFLFEDIEIPFPQIDPRVKIIRNDFGNLISETNTEIELMIPLSVWARKYDIDYTRAVLDFDLGEISGKIIDGAKYIEKDFVPNKENQIECQICHKFMNSISRTHLKKHNLNLKEYLIQFPEAKIISDKTKNRLSKASAGIPKSEIHKKRLSRSVRKTKRKKKA